MVYAALVLALLALVLALAARAKAGGFADRIEDAERNARRRTENAAEELEAELGTLRRIVAEIAAGRTPTPDMVLEGRLWRETTPEEGRKMVEEGQVRLVDARTPGEVARGRVPGAILIPVEELEERRGELPRDDRPTLIYCAAGVRSAAACEYLSSKGWSNLFNLEGGFQSWSGPTERPT